MKRTLLLFTILVASTTLLAQPATLPQLFQKVKEEVGKGRYTQALQDLAELDRISSQRGFERDREQLEPVIAFYRGVSYAGLGQEADARTAFRHYFELSPGAQLARNVFPSKIYDLFEEVRLESAKRSNALPQGDLREVFAAFKAAPLPADASWGDSPVRYLMTAEERATWSSLSSDAQRSAFVAEFWERHDPTPGTPANELRAEIERRIAFADLVFSNAELEGRLSDRALVFTFLGPPTLVSRTQLREGQTEVGAMRGAVQGTNLGKGHQSRSVGSPLKQEFAHGQVETWTYRKEQIPEALKFPELKFEFITRKGYGTDVLQKESRALLAIDQMATTARTEGSLE